MIKMVDNHNVPFFGQKTAMILKTGAEADPHMYITCIRKKGEAWEKVKEEGRTVKLTIIEIINISRVVNSKIPSWSTVHDFKNNKTRIEAMWTAGKDESADDVFWLKIAKYSKPYTLDQVEFLKIMLAHIVEEKIAKATLGKTYEKDTKVNLFATKSSRNTVSSSNTSKSNNSNKSNNESSEIIGSIIRSSDKAVLIQDENNIEFWCPKSGIVGEYDISTKDLQRLTIKQWLLDKRNEQ